MHESEKWKWSRSAVSDFTTPRTAAYQAPPSMGFSRQEYWSGLLLPSPILTPTYMEFRKTVMMWDSKRDTDIKNRLSDSMGEGEGGMIWENSIERCLLPHVKQMTSPSSMHEAGHSKQWTGSTQRDRMRREVGGGSGWGTHIHPWLIQVNVWQKPPQYFKVISLQLKLTN